MGLRVFCGIGRRDHHWTGSGLGNSWRVVVAAEMVVGTGSGLGYAIVQSRWSLDFTSAFVCIIVIAMIGLVVEQAVLKPLEKRTIRRWGIHRRDN
jgi:ABC-type nitrate/sulfonate/bicarbonate transport system permease component